MSQQPLVKLLTSSGGGSRRKMTEAIKQGRVTVNGEVVEGFNHPVEVGTDEVTLDGQRLGTETAEMVYLLLNKPKAVVSTTSDDRGNRTVIDIIPAKYRERRVYPVGRLDKDSTGLLLLSNDGDFTYLLTHPKFEREKEYLVAIGGSLTDEERRRLEQGLDLDDGRTSPAVVKAAKSPPFNYSITIHEGRKRQVRRMFAYLGHTVLELKRVRFDTLTIDNLPAGGVRELTAEEVRSLKRPLRHPHHRQPRGRRKP